MSDLYPVASVLLVAVPDRARMLAPWLRAVGEMARFGLEVRAPDQLEPEPERTCDVVVLDGESVADDEAREELMRWACDPLLTSLYIFKRMPSEEEVELALTWPSDFIQQGWRFGDRLRRRVQFVALAPWRQSMALRLEAERLGDRRLRVLPRPAERDPEPPSAWTEPETGPRLRRVDLGPSQALATAASTMGPGAAALVAEAFDEGRRVGVRRSREQAEDVCERFLDALDEKVDALTPELVAEMEASVRAVTDSPIVAARFGGASFAAVALRDEFRRIVREELRALERRTRPHLR